MAHFVRRVMGGKSRLKQCRCVATNSWLNWRTKTMVGSTPHCQIVIEHASATKTTPKYDVSIISAQSPLFPPLLRARAPQHTLSRQKPQLVDDDGRGIKVALLLQHCISRGSLVPKGVEDALLHIYSSHIYIYQTLVVL